VSFTTVPPERRRELAAASVTLNGEPARITGTALRYAHVTQVASGLSADWSWEAVERVVAKGGAFQS
jgi:hypothetical protein